MTLAEVKRTVRAGDKFQVTNHYIKRADHPCYGTNLRTVTRVNQSAINFDIGGRLEWPAASRVRVIDGTIEFYGGGLGQSSDELFLTLVRAAA